MKATINNILVSYLTDKLEEKGGRFNFASHTIESNLPNYGLRAFNKLHTPSSYARAFREIREKKKYPDQWIIKEVSSPTSTEKLFTIEVKKGEINAEISGDSRV